MPLVAAMATSGRARQCASAADIEDHIMDAKTGANIKTGKLTLGDKSIRSRSTREPSVPTCIDISKLYAETGIFTYDPGFTSTGSCESKITYIDGDEGVLLYRGYPIDDLAEHGDFLETCYLLLYGELPTPAQKVDFVDRVIASHDGSRADEPVLPGLPPRCPSDGGDGRLRRRAVGVLSRLHRHHRSDTSAWSPRSA